MHKIAILCIFFLLFSNKMLTFAAQCVTPYIVYRTNCNDKPLLIHEKVYINFKQ